MGKVMTVGVDHLQCQFEGAVTCDGMDLRILPGCPTTAQALYLDDHVSLRPGDRASAFGYIQEMDECGRVS